MKYYNEDDVIEINEKFDKMPYLEQLNLKQKSISDIFSRNRFSLTLKSIIPNPKPLNYRHKVVVSATNVKFNRKYKIALGLYKEGTKHIIPGVVNHIHDSDINNLLVTVEKVLQKYKFEAYSPKYEKGIIKHVLVRKSYYDKTMMLVFVTQGHIFPNHKLVVKDIVTLHPKVITVIKNIHNIDTPVVLLDKNLLLYGSGFIEDRIQDLKFRLSPNSFYQVNPIQMMNLYKVAMEFANISMTDTVMDCYSGIGTLSLIAAKQAKEVIAIESNINSVKDALYNKKANEINNVNFQLSEVENYLYDYEKPIDILIMDPARDGASQKFIDAIKKLKPAKIVYISCSVETQVRDLFMLDDLYKVERVQPVDMFSYTSHVETCVLLERK